MDFATLSLFLYLNIINIKLQHPVALCISDFVFQFVSSMCNVGRILNDVTNTRYKVERKVISEYQYFILTFL
jgi:hypothetical protein